METMVEALERMHLLLGRLSSDCGKELVGLREKNCIRLKYEADYAIV